VGGQGASAGAAALGNLVRGNSSQNGRGQPYTNYTMSFIDNLSVIERNHALKFGFEFRPIRLYTDRQGGTTYTYANIGSLLTNTPSNIQFLGDTSAPDPWTRVSARKRQDSDRVSWRVFLWGSLLADHSGRVESAGMPSVLPSEWDLSALIPTVV